MKNWQEEFDLIYNSDLFDHDFYRLRYHDVSLTGLSPLEHYLKYGRQMGRLPRDEKLQNIAPTECHGEKPLVSVVCITYNHEEFISQAIESIISQKTDFAFELLIGNDNSHDKTHEIILEYASRFPQIKYFNRETNLGANNNFTDLANRVEGKYVAICEGDDYWIDSKKLQKQVEFLKANPEYSICFHPVQIEYTSDPERIEFYPSSRPKQMSLDGLLKNNFIQTNSVVYKWRYNRVHAFSLPAEIAPADWFIHLLHAEVGRIGYIEKPMAVYRKHQSGMWSSHIDASERYKKLGNAEIRFYQSLIKRYGSKPEFLKAQCHIFNTLARIYIEEDEFDQLFALMSLHGNESLSYIREMGFEIKSPLRSAIELREEFFRQSSVDVIVTSFNHEKYISRCLDSVLCQAGLVNVRVIIGDDNSTDDTARVIEIYRQRFPEKIVVLGRDKNVGMLQNMKECISACTSPFIAFCEADDYWLSDRYLTKKLELMRGHSEVGMCFSWLLLHIEKSGTYVAHEGQSHLAMGQVPFPDLLDKPLTANFSCCMYSKAALQSIPPSYFNRKSAADWLLNLYVAENYKVLFYKELMSVYTIHPKGQWSGISADERFKLENSYKNEFRKIFKHRMNFRENEHKVFVSIKDISEACGSLICSLDSPVNGPIQIHDGKMCVSGWVLRRNHRKYSILIRDDVSLTEIHPTLSRADVIQSVYDTYYDESSFVCGFSAELQVEPGRETFIDLRLGDKIVPWASFKICE